MIRVHSKSPSYLFFLTSSRSRKGGVGELIREEQCFEKKENESKIYSCLHHAELASDVTKLLELLKWHKVHFVTESCKQEYFCGWPLLYMYV